MSIDIINGIVINTNTAFLVAAIIIIILSISQIMLYYRFKQVKHRYKLLLRGPTGTDLEQLLMNYSQVVKEIEQLTKEAKKEQLEMKVKLAKCLNTPQLLRFNAFDNMGSDLSFSMSMLNEQGDGVVITSLYGREENRLYAKPVYDGKSDYILSDEEKAVVEKTLKKI
ncbi:hypothetical protein Dtox_0769 [Desulfofarcimen acetoxidans DSM 771]|jgi:hypothetical protein|uniref:DUF4446 domain-containing protein n=1 Tax=Desulfofarcimen acetoxidans (strain ATCC 49208 / DSM 771 / KCTC 5769 / VKM B-1644 / 5575) TaxID=485916 RepID=C8W215_DESAS|nr:DUF4446 family protein [Desulfofarcimen acetoxidans]ACV61679.1 hypothetical protein Dtox_0769 [Desulfofarcimen acetoxidans DSM 771]